MATPSVAIEHDEDAQLCSEEFDAAVYVRDQLKGVKSGDEAQRLHTLRSKLHTLNVQCSDSIKKNVFLNYQQFIDTSKEISHLEREIYELSSLLCDQRLLIENLMQMSGEDRSSICTSSSVHTSNATINPINVLMQKMDGIAGVLNSLSNSERVILHGEVMQLDIDSKQPLHPAMLVLLTDRLLIGHPSTGKYRFHLESSHPLNALAAVNIKDRDSAEPVNTAFKLLIFPEQRVFRCESSRMKKDWLDTIEEAKRELLHEGSLMRQATIRGKRRSTDVPNSPTTTKSNSAASLLDTVLEQPKSPDETAWLNELPAELDDCIAHRDMEQAVELIMEWKSCSSRDTAIDAQLALRETHIVQLLSDEVRRPGALHGGPRAVRKAINLLTTLGRASQAIDLYLKKRSAALRSSARELTVSEEPLSYVRQLSQQFLGAIADVATEFTMQPEHFALILHWCSGELSVMLSLIRRHVIEVAPTMAVLAHTWRILMAHCESLIAIGADLTFEVHRLLAPSLKTALETNFANILESIRLRISEERWRVYNMESESNVNRFLEEMSDMGLCIDWALSPQHHSSIYITQNACHFSRVAHSLCRDLAVLRSSHLRALTDSFMIQLWKEYLEHLRNAPSSSIQQYTSTFVISQLLPLCDNIYDGSTCGLLSHLLRTDFEELLRYHTEEDTQDGPCTSDEEIAQNMSSYKGSIPMHASREVSQKPTFLMTNKLWPGSLQTICSQQTKTHIRRWFDSMHLHWFDIG